MPRKLSPALLSRIERLSGCSGRWIVDCRAVEGNYSYALRELRECWPFYTPDGERYYDEAEACRATGYHVGSPESAAFYCAATGWKARLLFCSEFLDADARWPGGYSAPSYMVSNARVFRYEFSRELEDADGDADGLSLDVRYITPDMLETITALEDYPLMDESDHGELELELQDEEWQNWAASEWRGAVVNALDAELPDTATRDADEILDAIPDIEDKLRDLFNTCSDAAGEYWEEQVCGGTSNGYYIRIDRIAAALDVHDLRDLTGLQLLTPDQQWRTEPYPWPDGSTTPLIKAEVV